MCEEHPSAAAGQAAFAAALTDPDAPPPVAIGPAQGRRFDVYRNNAAHGMIEALAASFPVVQKLVGETFFAALARAYLAAEPPTSPLLFRYGGGFGVFIEGFPPAASVPYLGDIARLEWLRLQAYHARDAAPIDLSALASLPPERLEGLRLGLHPSLGLLTSRWPVFSIWAETSGETIAAPVDLTRAEAVAVIRPALAVETRLLPPGAHGFLSALAGGTALGAAAARAAETAKDFDLAEHIGGVFSMGAVAALDLPETGPDTGDVR